MDVTDLDFRRLAYFAELARELHFGRAARNLGISQPTLSNQIKVLERNVGIRLFDRSNRTVELTNEGIDLLASALVVLAECENLANVARNAASVQSALRVGYSRSGILTGQRKIIDAFRNDNPRIALSTEVDWGTRNIERVLSGEIDVAFVRPPMKSGDLDFLEVSTEELVLLVPEDHRLAEKKRIQRADISREPLVMWPRAYGPEFQDFLFGQIWTESPPVLVREEPNYMHVCAAVAEGVGISLVDQSIAATGTPSGVVVRHFAAPAPMSVIAVAWISREPSEALQCFIEVCGRFSYPIVKWDSRAFRPARAAPSHSS